LSLRQHGAGESQREESGKKFVHGIPFERLSGGAVDDSSGADKGVASGNGARALQVDLTQA